MTCTECRGISQVRLILGQTFRGLPSVQETIHPNIIIINMLEHVRVKPRIDRFLFGESGVCWSSSTEEADCTCVRFMQGVDRNGDNRNGKRLLGSSGLFTISDSGFLCAFERALTFGAEEGAAAPSPQGSHSLRAPPVSRHAAPWCSPPMQEEGAKVASTGQASEAEASSTQSEC